MLVVSVQPPTRISRQREIKRKQFNSPTEVMTKSGVEEERLGDKVVIQMDVTFQVVAIPGWFR